MFFDECLTIQRKIETVERPLRDRCLMQPASQLIIEENQQISINESELHWKPIEIHIL